jgi:hypothetical protein
MQRYSLAADRPRVRGDVQQFKTESANDLPSRAIRLRHWRDYRDSGGVVKQIRERGPCGAQRPAALARRQDRGVHFVKVIGQRTENRAAMPPDKTEITRIGSDRRKIEAPNYRAAHPRVNLGMSDNRVDGPRIVDAVNIVIV